MTVKTLPLISTRSYKVVRLFSNSNSEHLFSYHLTIHPHWYLIQLNCMTILERGQQRNWHTQPMNCVSFYPLRMQEGMVKQTKQSASQTEINTNEENESEKLTVTITMTIPMTLDKLYMCFNIHFEFMSADQNLNEYFNRGVGQTPIEFHPIC